MNCAIEIMTDGTARKISFFFSGDLLNKNGNGGVR